MQMKADTFNDSIEFEKVDGNPSQIERLYELLKERRHCISHQILPSYEEHKMFVLGVPYRAWYLVLRGNICLGSFYLQEDNSIGINLIDESLEVLSQCMRYITETHNPRKEIKSKVPPYFYINAPFENGNIQRSLEGLGCVPVQISYVLAP